MTRSDIVLAIHYANTMEKKDELIHQLNKKIEDVYSILYVMEQERWKNYAGLAELLRNALESKLVNEKYDDEEYFG